jgi:hypothetical protein
MSSGKLEVKSQKKREPDAKSWLRQAVAWF